VLAAMVLSMLATPFVILYSNRIVMRLVASDWLMQSVQLTAIAEVHPQQAHVIICGYGRSGQNLARLLEQEHPLHGAGPGPGPGAPGGAAGQSVVFGDAARLPA
jgi:CPA2 family monovalent cation:H+ antiporter-2